MLQKASSWGVAYGGPLKRDLADLLLEVRELRKGSERDTLTAALNKCCHLHNK